MNLDGTQRNSVPVEPLFDPSEEWLRAARAAEPDFSIDGLRRTSVFERVLRLLGKRKD